MSSVEQLSARNFRLRLRLLVSVESKKIEGDYFIENISPGGLFIETNFPLGEGEEFTISFTLPHNRKEYSIASKVMWTRKKSATGENPGMGISFLNVPRAEHDGIMDALSQYRELLDG